MTTTLSTTLSPSGAVSSAGLDFVTLEPVISADAVSQATLYDIYRMFLRAQAGIPASTYKASGCPIEFDGDLVRITMEFYTLPSSQDLPFDISSSLGAGAEISVPEIVELPRERDILFDMTDHHDLDFLPLFASLSWQTPCYSRDGVPLSQPALTIDQGRIHLPQELFGVARLAATAWGHKYKLTITVDKGDNRLTGLAPVITAVWAGGDQQLDLPLPPCVEFALSLCDGDLGNTYCSHALRGVTVYYSTCSGKVIAVIPGPDPESYCSDIAA